MFNWIKNRRARAEERRAAAAKKKADAEAQLEQELDKMTEALKGVLIQSGIHVVGWGVRSRSGDFARMYGLLNGRLLEATLSRKGGLVLYYVGEEK